MPKEPRKDNAPKDPEKRAEDAALDDELEDTFPASDPPAATRPGHGITGPEAKPKKTDQSPS